MFISCLWPMWKKYFQKAQTLMQMRKQKNGDTPALNLFVYVLNVYFSKNGKRCKFFVSFIFRAHHQHFQRLLQLSIFVLPYDSMEIFWPQLSVVIGLNSDKRWQRFVKCVWSRAANCWAAGSLEVWAWLLRHWGSRLLVMMGWLGGFSVPIHTTQYKD